MPPRQKTFLESMPTAALITLALVLLLTAGCDPEQAPEGGPSELCPDGHARGPATLRLQRIAPFTPSPEGVAVCPGGDIFVTVDGPDEIRRVPLDGSPSSLVAKLPGVQPAGLTCDERGRLFVAGFSNRDGTPSPPMLMVPKTGGDVVRLPAPEGGQGVFGLNGIVAVPGVGIIASDTGGGQLLLAQQRPGGSFVTQVIANDLLGANGLAYDPRTRRLHVVISFLPARVISFQLGANGSLSGRRTEFSAGLLTLLDGVAVDETGELYVADYLGGQILHGRDGEPLAKLSSPASFAFRGGSLLTTSYLLGNPRGEGGLYRLAVGRCGAYAD